MTPRKALKKLWLRENQLSGEIPKELGGEHGGLCNLQELYLSNNQLRTLGKKMSGEGDKKIPYTSRATSWKGIWTPKTYRSNTVFTL